MNRRSKRTRIPYRSSRNIRAPARILNRYNPGASAIQIQVGSPRGIDAAEVVA